MDSCEISLPPTSDLESSHHRMFFLCFGSVTRMLRREPRVGAYRIVPLLARRPRRSPRCCPRRPPPCLPWTGPWVRAGPTNAMLHTNPSLVGLAQPIITNSRLASLPLRPHPYHSHILNPQPASRILITRRLSSTGGHQRRRTGRLLKRSQARTDNRTTPPPSRPPPNPPTLSRHQDISHHHIRRSSTDTLARSPRRLW